MVLAFDIGASRIKAATAQGRLGAVPAPLAAFGAALRGLLSGRECDLALSTAGIIPPQGRAKVSADAGLIGKLPAGEVGDAA